MVAELGGGTLYRNFPRPDTVSRNSLPGSARSHGPEVPQRQAAKRGGRALKQRGSEGAL